jgi:transposase
MDKKIIQKAGKYYTLEERHQIIQELITTGCTKVEIWEKYTGDIEEHGQLLRWMRQLGYSVGIKTRRPNIVSNNYLMVTKKSKPDKEIKIEDDSFENLQLKKRIADLEKQLKDAELKAIAFSTMVDIAEKEFNIPIRKKLNTKP